MNSSFTRPFLIVALLATSLVKAEAQSVDSFEADKIALRALGARYEEAINQGNLNLLSDSVLPDATIVFMTNDELKGLPAMQSYVESVQKRLGDGAVYRVKLQPHDTDFQGDIAIAQGTSDESVTFGNGKTIAYTTKWTAVLKKADGIWKAARLHVSLDPIDNPIIRMQWNLRLWIAGIGGLIVGIIGMLLIQKMRTSRSSNVRTEPR